MKTDQQENSDLEIPRN